MVDLTVRFPVGAGVVQPVRGVSFRIERAEAVGVVGESGSGKSLTALAVARLIEEPGVVGARRLRFLGADLLAGADGLRHLLGTSLSMVFQDPGTSFNPTRRVGGQLAEVGRYHLGMSRSRRPPGRSNGSARSASPRPSGAPASTRTSSRAACASAR